MFNILFITDHSGHTSGNSLYPLVRELQKHGSCGDVHVLSRASRLNAPFFKDHRRMPAFVAPVDATFDYSSDGAPFTEKLQQSHLAAYDVVFLRLPPPVDPKFLRFVSSVFAGKLIINDPSGIAISGDKRFLMRFPELCPPMKVCTSVKDIIDFKSNFPIVLKPTNGFGGRGLVRIEDNSVWFENQPTTLGWFLNHIHRKDIEYLAMKFLNHVEKSGDKRIVVANGAVLGAALRKPATGSWICNVAMGGVSEAATITPEEQAMIEVLNPVMNELGILLYGIDTLEDGNGKRLLSEINTTSVGGLGSIAGINGQLPVERAAELIWNYILEKSKS